MKNGRREEHILKKEGLRAMKDSESESGKSQGLDHKQLEVIRDFFLYLFRTYVGMKLFMKGIHLTIDGWQANRNKDGWKEKSKKRKEGGVGANLPRKANKVLVWNAELGGFVVEKLNAPAWVKPATRRWSGSFRDLPHQKIW